MEPILSKCGNRCDLCPAYHKNIDKFDKQKISDGWFKYHGLRKPADDIGCVGCGRCIVSCPVNIDVRDVVRDMNL